MVATAAAAHAVFSVDVAAGRTSLFSLVVLEVDDVVAGTAAGGMVLFSLEVLEILEVDDVDGRDDAGYIVTTNVSVVVARTWKVCCSLEEKDDTESAAEAVVIGQTVMRTVSVVVARTVTGSRSRDVVGGIDGATWLIELIELAAGIGGIDVVVGGRDAAAGCIDMTAGGTEVVVGGIGGIDVVVGGRDTTTGSIELGAGIGGIEVVVGGTGGIDVVVGWIDVVVGLTEVLGA